MAFITIRIVIARWNGSASTKAASRARQFGAAMSCVFMCPLLFRAWRFLCASSKRIGVFRKRGPGCRLHFAMNILSVQSAVSYGHVGNSAAVFALQRLGHEVWRVDTVRFSNHPGHGGFRGTAASAGELADLIDGLSERGWLARADAILTGYLGAADQGSVVAAAAARVKAANPRALWALDPVIGDKGRVFVKPGVPEFLARRPATPTS